MMPIAYIAHPYSNAPKANLKEVRRIIKEMILENKVRPFCPWYAFVEALDDTNAGERGLGILATTSFINKKHCDVLYLYGSFISEGMQLEINAATNNGVPLQIMDKRITQEMLIKACLKQNLREPKFL